MTTLNAGPGSIGFDTDDRTADGLVKPVESTSPPAGSPVPQPGGSPVPQPAGGAVPQRAGQPAAMLFFPKECETFKDTGLPEALIESLVFKHLLAVGSNTGRGICRDLCLPGKAMPAMLSDLKSRQFVVYKGAASMGDFEYTLTEAGRERARSYLGESTFCGAAPVPLAEYVEAVKAQTITQEEPGPGQLRHAFSDLLINDKMFARLGPAINSGRGMFLYGSPGNGKTSIAERITLCFGTHIWIPKAVFVEGQIIQLFDPQCHKPVGSEKPSIIKGRAHDTRWIKIKRPTIVVGGELTMDGLELCHNPTTKITEPSVQLKSNCGTLVIDDFGRQRMDPVELLNRWIVPLEKRYDFLTLSNGKKIKVPFDQLIIFSTNLEPRELVDDAFLRRIPYKINIIDPTEEEFRDLMRLMAKVFEIDYDDRAVDHLIERHYKAVNCPFRCCHPRDLILQIINRARFLKQPPVMSPEGFDAACECYFAVL